MEFALTPLEDGSRGMGDLPRDLLGQLTRMAMRGHRPAPCVVVRLSDGRVKGFPGDDARARLARLVNTHGPASVALRLSCEALPGALLLTVEDLKPGGERLQRRLEETPSGGWRQAGDSCASAAAGCAAELSRNTLILAASLGITMGALPNGDSSLTPAGVSNSPV